jgi:hypothetical protein
MADPVCVYCKRDVDPNQPYVYQRTIGWEHKAFLASRRGGSDIVLREPVPDVFACQFCVDKLKAGVSVAQESLL